MTDPQPLLEALDRAEPKPGPRADRDVKKNYAQRLSNALAQTVADALRPAFPKITPAADGSGQEAAVPVSRGTKRLDVKVTDPTLGLILSVSIKTYSFQDYSPRRDQLGRWTKNIVRNDHELRGEAMVLHQRQPYSVLVALMFEPYEICDDGGSGGTSSFAHHVTTLSKRTGRGRRPIHGGAAGAYVEYGAEDSRHDLFERVYIGLYEQHGDARGTVHFFDVENPPPRDGRPPIESMLTFEQLIRTIREDVDRRNRMAPAWAAEDEAAADDVAVS
ncbi:hypothetical protein [Conexibacter arvalis]|uniref:Uncharacterized protein n=1 Tax=Conexibacter arvalis TaxID=912552 RepID=A0A840IE56_9ACTN|nr:hypothetical protein [Conexibacter arvalis]MBB4663072.1 hypothetical protein [Conexibacter arvalis]